MERKYWTLLVLDEARPGSLSPLQLQKTLFLISKNLPNEIGADFYQFVPYNYGPFDSDVYSDVRILVNEGLVAKVQIVGRSWVSYEITPQGHQAATDVRPQISERASRYIGKVVRWVESVTFTQLLSAIYRVYPEYKAKSVFVG
jgi:uncharacterized protein YwgA